MLVIISNKKGFVLIETIIVMSVLLIGMIILYSNYNKMIINSSKVNYYDNVDDMYTAYYAYKYVNDLATWNSDNDYKVIKIDDSLGENFKNIFRNLSIETIYYFSKKGFENIFSEKDGKCEDKPNQLLCYDGTTINYLRSIENKNDTSKCDDSNQVPCITIVKINRDDHYYFAKYEAYNDNEIKIDDSKDEFDKPNGFKFTGKNQIYIVPKTGTYELEVWGAQGGSYTKGKVTGGYGAYSVGTVWLHKGDYLFVVVGGKGTDGIKNNEVLGGYNGGGNGNSNSNFFVSGGGGATHIALRSGLLSELEKYKDDILIVAGGGGGSAFQNNAANNKNNQNYSQGGSGGGHIGVSATTTVKSIVNDPPLSTGGTQSSIGSGIYNGAFGLGASCIKNTQKIYCSGGGAGLYGGSSGENVAGGSGGSGYIDNTDLTNKYMYCYNCTESTDKNTYTINTIGSSDKTDKENCPDGYFDFVGNDITPDKAIEKCAKAGDGYARITYINSEK